MKPVSPQAAQLYEFIEREYQRHGQCPTIREMMGGVYNSAAKIQNLTTELIVNGWCELLDRRERFLKPVKYPKVYYRGDGFDA